jgi:hypothetical protein
MVKCYECNEKYRFRSACMQSNVLKNAVGTVNLVTHILKPSASQNSW